MFSLSASSLSRRLGALIALLPLMAVPSAVAVVQVASGTPVVDEDTNVVEVPLYFYTDEAVTAGQFDVSVPEGWSVLQVEAETGLGGTHSIAADGLEDGGIRVVVFSLNNSEVPDGSLGRILLEPPSVGEIASLTFSNSLFVVEGGQTLGLTPGFPALRIIGQPASQTILAGQTASVSVSALGIDPTFAWYAGSSGDTSSPLGAASHTLKTPTLLNNASYWVRVSDTFGETVDSASALITVDTGPTYVFSPNSRSVGWRAGTGSAMLSTPSGNAWTASSSASWLTLTTAAGTGPLGIPYSYAANNSLTPRSSQISVGGVTFTLNQSAKPPLFRDYPLAGAGSPWRSVPWFGFVSDTYYPWIYHANHGWLYIIHQGNLDGFFAYSAEGDLGWLYISQNLYKAQARWLYSFKHESYLFFLPVDSANPEVRFFYHLNEKRWFTYPGN